ncbi:response regulator transcription factor [Paenibacillus sp. MMS20-IR301]|uniref:response regulator transcription factor n=1 Tax=Paenibacillus sp. MMS20-IR301 TaxID=2895946 RepID=UPI0028EE0C7B|nr:response regulator transcription factor [Paenibacillus sp. MMS20-IR301]WNS45899.1 response regulator transcription factor [Paenibacillus sp. MMS20-IR301]
MNPLCKVLIVDDEILVRQGIKYVLDWEREGFQIVGEAANGQEALNLLDALQPHIIITDIVMPVMDGEELTRLVKRDYPETEVIVLSSFSEFHYVRSTFQSGVADYILKPKLEAGSLLQVLQQTRARIPGLGALSAAAGRAAEAAGQPLDALLGRMISGYRLQPEDEAAVSRQLPHSCFGLLGWETGGRPGHAGGPDAGTGSDDAVTAITTAVTGELARRLPGLIQTLLPGGGHSAWLLINLPESEWPQLLETVHALAQVLAGQEPELRLSLSRPFTSLSSMAAVHQESDLKLQQFRFFLPDQVLLVHEELPQGEGQLPKFNLTQFTEQLKRQQLEEAFGDLHQYVDVLSRQYDGDVFQFKSFLGNIIFNVTNQFSHLRELEEGKYGRFRAVDEAQSADEAMRILDDFVALIMKLTHSAALAPGSNANMAKLLQYMEEHYAEPLSLTELARHFHFNPSYLSSLFTTYNREGFKEHLNSIRTGKAAELLRAGEAAISEISSMVGYGDHSYFCKVFKKYTGLSPSGYRRQYYGQE